MSYAAGAVMETLVLGGFALRHKIGEGGFGTVFLAEQQALGRTAVVKVMRRSLAHRQDAIERFELEARLASQLDHPCAAHIYAFGAEPDGTLWIAMEHVKGTTLDVLLQSGPLSIDRVLPMLERLCEAVQTAHDQGIVHRDIKPANVMVTARGGRLVPKLLDFGIAKQLAVSSEVPAVVRAKRASIAPEPRQLDQTHLAEPEATPSSSASLTQAGQVLGSPPYMAPEQWVDASLAGPATDQYALALLAYEALTGTRACDGRTLAVLAYQHLEAPLPTSPRISDAVHAVLSRAAAKAPGDRFADLNQLVAALRAATGWTADVETPVATLPAAVQAMWQTDAPQPIAETVGLLANARSPIRVIERATGVARVLARWLGVVAVACRSRMGRLDAHTRSKALDALRALRHETPRDEDWIDLAVELAREATDHPEVWPIPELVTWCADATAVDALRELVRGQTTLVDAAADTSRARAVAQLAALERVLDGLAWLLDYEIGREVDGGIELWMGARTDERVVRHGPSDGGGDVVALDADGARIVKLSPLICIAAPMAGEAEELFVFGGPGRADAATFTALPRGFERDDAAVWPWLAQHVLDGGGDSHAEDDDERPPYPGLAAYTADDHASFVGREREVGELVNRLRTQPLVAVVGPSGAGKSSFLAAGVVPGLPTGWFAQLIRPGRDPVGALAALVDRVESSPYRDGEHAPPTTPAEIAARLVHGAQRRSGTLVLVVDQAEELFTQGAGDAGRIAFAETLVALAAAPCARVVIGMRDDFLCRVDDIAPWRGLLGRAVHILGVPSRADLERIVVEPARRRGYTFDHPGLAREIVDELADRHGALPLLSFVATELWERRDRHFRRITKAAYEQCGGVTGALVQHADGVVDRLPAADRRVVRLAFGRLLTAEGARIAQGRAELAGALGPQAGNVLDKLLAARLVVSRDDDAGERIEIIHEALATMWPRLARWRRDDAANAKLHEQLAAAARHWDDRGRPAELLWRGHALAEVRRWRATGDVAITAIEAAFADAGEAAARRTRRRRIGILVAAFAVLGSGVVALALSNRTIARQRADAQDRVVAGFEDRARAALADGQPGKALVYLGEAQRLGARGAAHELLLGRTLSPISALAAVEVRDPDPVFGVQLDGDQVLTIEERSAHLWRAGGVVRAVDHTATATLADHAIVSLSSTGEVVFGSRWRTATGLTVDAGSPNASDPSFGIAASEHAIAAYGGRALRLLDSADGRVRATVELPAPIQAIAFDRAGARLAVFDASGATTVWDTAAGARLSTCASPASRARANTNGRAIAFVPGHELVVVGGFDGMVRVCGAADGTLRHRLSGHRGPVLGIDVSDDGAVIATAGVDATAQLWETATGKPLGALAGHRGMVRHVRFSPDHRRLATGGDDGVRVWDTDAQAALAAFPETDRVVDVAWRSNHELLSTSASGVVSRFELDHVRDAIGIAGTTDFATAGTRIVTVGEGRAAIRDVATTAVIAELRAEAPIFAAALAGEHVVSIDTRGGMQVWSLTGSLERAFATGDRELTNIEATPDGRFVMTTAPTGKLKLWSADGTRAGELDVGFAAEMLAFDPGGRWVAATEYDARQIVIVDLRALAVVARLPADAEISAITADRTRVAVVANRKTSVFDTSTWAEVVATAPTHMFATVLLEDGRFVTAGDSAIAVWDRHGNRLASLATTSRAIKLAAAPDQRLLVSGTSDGGIEVWDLATYRSLLVLRGHRQPITFVAFSRDGTRVVTAARGDAHVASWDLAGRVVAQPELARLVKCRVPYELAGDTLLPRDLELDDPACR